MCTVTFIPRSTGYCLSMNRDEKLSRARGLPPGRRGTTDYSIVCPSEPSGGTWIAVNDRGSSLALINWYSVKASVPRDSLSRGEIIPALWSHRSLAAVDSALAKLPLARIKPFRLIGIFHEDREIAEWRWNLTSLKKRHCHWQAQQWISSGYDEPTAQEIRSNTFRLGLAGRSSGTLDWLRRLHRSHSPVRGPFSTCMHREDASTVSYTEVSVSAKRAVMRHVLGSPCAGWRKLRDKVWMLPIGVSPAPTRKSGEAGARDVMRHHRRHLLKPSRQGGD
jgi:hypothetical protein